MQVARAKAAHREGKNEIGIRWHLAQGEKAAKDAHEALLRQTIYHPAEGRYRPLVK